MRDGWEREEALREAERRFGDIERIRAEMISARWKKGGRMKVFGMLRSVGADLRHALRGIRSAPAFTAAVVVTLALGIGATASIFAVVDALMLRPIPYRQADRLVEVNRARSDGGHIPGLAASRLPEWREAWGAFADGWLAYYRTTLVRTDGEVAEPLSVVAVTPGADTLLGIPLLMGRAFTADDARPGSPEVAVLARHYFERLGADPAILGRTIRLESGPATVVGVLRGGIKFPDYADAPDVWLPLRDDVSVAGRPLRSVQGVWVRLQPGISLAEARERAAARADALEEQDPAEGAWRVRLVPVGDYRGSPGVQRALWILAATVGTIFLIALVNGVNLLLVRGRTRARELAIRRALGSSGGRLLRQLLCEGLILGLLGGVAALALAWAAVGAMQGLLPGEVVFFSPHAFEVEGRTLAFAFGASLLAGTVLGLLPAFQILRAKAGSLALAGRVADDTPAGRRLQRGLVVAQVALSMTLLAGAALFVKSFAALTAEDPGFDHRRIALAAIELSSARYPEASDRAEFVRRLRETLAARPGVEAVTVSDGTGFTFGAPLQAEGEPPPEDQADLIPHTGVAPDYPEVMGVDLVEGRSFEAGDEETDAVIVDRDLARFLWGGGSAVGRRFRMGEEGDWMRVVGVARELRLMGRDERQGPYQFLVPTASDRAGRYVEVAVRAVGSTGPRTLLPALRDAVRALDPEQAIWRLRTAADALAEEEQTPRFLVTLMIVLAAVGATLAAVGLYGVLAYTVTRRRRELGVRMALGAGCGRLRGMVLGEGVVLAAVGIILGLGGALLASRSVEQLLYQVEPRDPGALALAGVLFLAVAVAASFFPAHRATRTDPVEVLREE